MRTATRGKVRRPRRARTIHKPRGALQARVQKVGPEHFGIVCVDCAKVQSKWMLADFYGNVLVPPTPLPHHQGHLNLAIFQLRAAIEAHALGDVVVVLEQTGNYHQCVKRAFRAAGFECRTMHPLASRPFRQAANPGNKTDDTDLFAIFRAAVCGFGLAEPAAQPVYEQLRLWVRHRRDLVEKRSAVCCQLQEHWEAALPGFTRVFEDCFRSPIAQAVAAQCCTPAAVEQAGAEGLRQWVRQRGQQVQGATLERVLAWARTAAPPDPQAALHQHIGLALEADRAEKTREIQAAEVVIASLLVQTPYVLLLAFPGINVASAGELAGEMGPIADYPSGRAIIGRAGLYPSRYQSDEVDLPDGHLVRCANRRIRGALLTIADNLRKCNNHFRGMADLWDRQSHAPIHTRIKIVSRFTRIAYPILASGRILPHRCLQPRGMILDKLIGFHQDHQTPPDRMLADLQAAIAQLPSSDHPTEASPLVQRLAETRRARKRGPQPIGDILPLLLAKLGVSEVQSSSIGVRDLS